MKTLFKNVNILVKNNGKYETIKNGFLGVDGKYIDYISDVAPEKKYDVEKNYSNKLLMPGLVNSHTHIPMVFMRAMGSDANLQDWLNKYIFPTEAKMKPEHVKWASYYAIMEMLASGTTSFTDMYFFSEQTAQAVIDTGIKANINKYLLCFDPNMKIEDSGINQSVEFVKKYDGLADGRLKADFAIHAEYTNQPHIVKEYSRLCKEYNGRMHIHLSETKKETDECINKYGVTPTKWFEQLGTFDSPTTAAHCVWCNDEDVQILKKHDVTVAHNPSSNMMLGSGFIPYEKFKRNGVRVGLGTDGAASNNNLNMFEEMSVANLITDGFHLNPNSISVTEVLDMATINGAIGQGRNETGELKVGKCADIIAIDFDKLHLYPVFDYATLLVTSCQGSDVCMNMVDGNILYEDGKFLTIDSELIKKEFKKVVEEFYN